MTHLRAYIAGLGSGGALLAAVIIALIALGGVVAVETLPDSSRSASADDVLVQSGAPGTGESAETSSGSAAQARDRGRGHGNAGGGARDHRDHRSGAVHGGAPGFDGEAVGSPQPLPPTSPPSDLPTLTPPPSDEDPPQPPEDPHPNPPDPKPPKPPKSPVPVPVPSGQGPVGGLVGVVNETVRGAGGTDPHLPGTITPITNPIDEIIGGLTGGKGGVPPLPR